MSETSKKKKKAKSAKPLHLRSCAACGLWDSENLKVTNLPEANQYLHYEYRKGWTL